MDGRDRRAADGAPPAPSRVLDSIPVTSFKSVYLIHGDDHGRIAERRSKLRSMAEEQSGTAGIELLEGESATVDAVVSAVCSMSLATGRRFVIADGVQRWKAKEIEPLTQLIASMPPDTTLALFAREEGRNKVTDGLVDAVKKAGGAVSSEVAVKPWKLAEWVRGQAAEMGLAIDNEAAKMLVVIVGERQQRLLRELEKIALAVESGTRVDAEIVGELAAGSADRKIWAFADALVNGQARRSTRVWLELDGQGERAGALVGIGARRLRDACDAADRLDAGEPVSSVKGSLRMPPKAADAFIRDVQRTGPAELRDALCALADLEAATRGGSLPMDERTAVARLLDSVSG